MIIGAIKEHDPRENRTALTPRTVKHLTDAGHTILLEQGIGEKSGFSDEEYKKAGANLREDSIEIYQKCHILFQILPPDNNVFRNLTSKQLIAADFRNHLFTLQSEYPKILRLELVPRTSVAQSIDILSAQSTVRGYMAALYALYNARRLAPQLMTAAASVKAAAALVIGASVTGLQAATVFKRMGCRVTLADINEKNKELARSVGAEFALAATSEDYLSILKDKTFVLAAAAAPDGKSPKILSQSWLEYLKKGAIIVDTTTQNIEIETNLKTTNHFHFYRNLYAERLAPETASELWSSNMHNLLNIIITPDDELDLSAAYIEPMLFTPDQPQISNSFTQRTPLSLRL